MLSKYGQTECQQIIRAHKDLSKTHAELSDHLPIGKVESNLATITQRRYAWLTQPGSRGSVRCIRSMNPTYREIGPWFTVASLASSSTAAALRSLLPTRHAATAQVRGAATYKALGR